MRRIVLFGLVLYQAFFLNVLLPGHTRGAVRIGTQSAGRDSCCGRAPSQDKRDTPTPRERSNCAVCHFMARMTSVLPVDLTLAKLGLVESLAFPSPQVVEALKFVPTYHGRAPPVA
jgi:hypothetical protein